LPTLTASNSGFVNGDTSASLATLPTLSTTATSGSHVSGSPYAITASGAADPDYAISYVAGSLSVTPAALTITANNQTKVYGAALPTLTASYAGFVNGDTPASLTTLPALTTTATSVSAVGGYAITASGAVDSDYAISYVAGTLTVSAALIATPIPTTPILTANSTATPIVTNSPVPTGTSEPSPTPTVQNSPTPVPSSPTATASPTVFPRATAASVVVKGKRFTLSVATGTIAPGQPLTMTARLSSVDTGKLAASATSATVTFNDDKTILGTSKLVGGIAVLTTTKLGSGVHDLTATLNGQKGAGNITTPPVIVIAQMKGEVIPLLVLHNLTRTVVGGRTLACEVKQNSFSLVQKGCELVTSDWLAGAKVTYSVSFLNGKTQVFTNTADGHGHSQILFNVAYRPKAVNKGLARDMVLITVHAVLSKGTTAGSTTIRFAVQR
ncbi:MAG: Cadherin-like beta sandwich protein, partial [Chloroflexi bacterium]|nr:Cadherin-like beta sandwich protein [Chloroflexota bacterium]